MKKYINKVLSFGSLLLLLYTVYDQHKQIKKLKNDLKICTLKNK
jgi:hypothetical protein